MATEPLIIPTLRQYAGQRQREAAAEYENVTLKEVKECHPVSWWKQEYYRWLEETLKENRGRPLLKRCADKICEDLSETDWIHFARNYEWIVPPYYVLPSCRGKGE